MKIRISLISQNDASIFLFCNRKLSKTACQSCSLPLLMSFSWNGLRVWSCPDGVRFRGIRLYTLRHRRTVKKTLKVTQKHQITASVVFEKVWQQPQEGCPLGLLASRALPVEVLMIKISQQLIGQFFCLFVRISFPYFMVKRLQSDFQTMVGKSYARGVIKGAEFYRFHFDNHSLVKRNLNLKKYPSQRKSSF